MSNQTDPIGQKQTQQALIRSIALRDMMAFLLAVMAEKEEDPAKFIERFALILDRRIAATGVEAAEDQTLAAGLQAEFDWTIAVAQRALGLGKAK